MVNSTGCTSLVFPHIAVHNIHSLFGNQNAIASGLKMALAYRFPDQVKDVVVLAGDGATDPGRVGVHRTLHLGGLADDDMALELNYQVLGTGAAVVSLGMASGVVDLTASINKNNGRGWQRSLVKLSCFEDRGATMESMSEPFVLAADGPLTLQLSSVRIVANLGDAGCE